MAKAESSVSTIYKVVQTIEPFYGGGKIDSLIGDKDTGSCGVLYRAGANFSLRSVEGFSMLGLLRLDDEDNNITVYCLKDANSLITCNTDNVFECWPLSLSGTDTGTEDPVPNTIKSLYSWKVTYPANFLILHNPLYLGSCISNFGDDSSPGLSTTGDRFSRSRYSSMGQPEATLHA